MCSDDVNRCCRVQILYDHRTNYSRFFQFVFSVPDKHFSERGRVWTNGQVVFFNLLTALCEAAAETIAIVLFSSQEQYLNWKRTNTVWTWPNTTACVIDIVINSQWADPGDSTFESWSSSKYTGNVNARAVRITKRQRQGGKTIRFFYYSNCYTSQLLDHRLEIKANFRFRV